MKQSKEQTKRLVVSDLLYAYGQMAELKGYMQTYGDAPFLENHKSQLDMALQSIKSVIQLIIEE